MKKYFLSLPMVIISLLFVLCLGSCAYSQNAATESKEGTVDFSFIQLSDSHVSPYYDIPEMSDSLRSYPCIKTMKDLGDIFLKPYNVTAPKSRFIVHTGDITEFGFAGVTWDVLNKYFEGITIPIYLINGNHDNTWVSDTERFRRLHGGINYSFDYEGFHFICLNSATLQDPVPSFGEEVIDFLRNDLKKIYKKTPVFVSFHHPLTSNEFCSTYDVDRMIDLLRGYNIVLMMDGHGHSAVKHDYWGIDGVEGGSPFSKGKPENEGFNVIYIKGNQLYVAYKSWQQAEAAKALIQKTIPPNLPYPLITIKSPVENSVVTGEEILIGVAIENNPYRIKGVSYTIDEEVNNVVTPPSDRIVVKYPSKGLCNGAHFLRVIFEEEGGKKYQKSISFFIDNPGSPNMGTALWRYQMKGGTKASPLCYKNMVLVGANDGAFYALNAQNGNLIWKQDIGAEILGTAAAYEDLILFGAGNGKFYAFNLKGEPVWNFDAGAAVYSAPVVDETGIVYFGTNQAKIFALEAKTGKHLWINADARQSVESQTFVTKDHLFFGSWDGYVYCLNKKDGATLWKKPGPKNQTRVITYYGPADNGPVACGDKVFIADRGYTAGAYDMSGNYIKTIDQDCSAIGLSEDGKSLYLRGLKNPMKKIDSDGKVLWTSRVVAGRLPVSPQEKNGVVYICTNSGRLNAVDAATGNALWEYQVTPKLFVMSGVDFGDGVVYATGLDGFVTAIARK
ncbi:PQQ-binding-like beta-propeller repeat protein [Candidatus Sumerlaeota bacterium]|nr:PQQ-binding-like beta-propeller repeat protein [Candidatus Sumerlaeota bacterium]